MANSRDTNNCRWAIQLVVLLLASFLTAAACTNQSDNEPANNGAPAATSSENEGTTRSRTDLRPTIRLGVTAWTGARVNVAIAEQLMELQLGYPVDVVQITDMTATFGDLRTGRLDAVLEVWPSGLEPSQRDLVETGAVANLGELGVIGKTGWFVPRYLVEEDSALGSWEAYADPDVAARFISEETGNRGRLLGTDPAWEQFDEELIESLDLPFEVVYSGSETATRAELDRKTAASEPILLYWWTPTPEVAQYDLVNVVLPERTPECLSSFNEGGLASCDYPEDRLLKLAANDLLERQPTIHGFLSAFSLSTEDQLALIDEVDNLGSPIDEAAAGWIQSNEATWRSWLG